MGLHAAREPHRDATGAEVCLFGDPEPEYVAEQVGDRLDVRSVQQGMVETGASHATRFGLPDVRIDHLGTEVRSVHLRVQLDAVATRDLEADSATDAGLLAGLDVVDADVVRLELRGEFVERGLVEHLERHHVHAGLVGLAEDDTVAIELVPALQVDASVTPGADLVQPETIAVVDDRLVHVEDSDLDETWTENSVDCHGVCPSCTRLVGACWIGVCWIGVDWLVDPRRSGR